MSQRIYVVCYNKQHTVNISINVYELDHETPTYLFLKEYGGISKRQKDSITWFTTLDDTKKHIRKIVNDRIQKLKNELSYFESFESAQFNEIPAIGHTGPIVLE